MGIARYELITVNQLTFAKSSFGEQTTSIAEWFRSRALTQDVSNNVRISEKYRVYQDLVNFTLNFTPNTKQIVDRQDLYSITWRGNDWRITDVRESNDKMMVTLLCYRSDPNTAV